MAVNSPVTAMMINYFTDLYWRRHNLKIGVAGRGPTLMALDTAIHMNHLSVDDMASSSPYDAFVKSLDFLVLQNSWPDMKLSDFALFKVSPQERAMMGITEEDFLTDASASIKYLATPPFLFSGFNLDFGLALMRMISKYHDGNSPDGPRIYQLGIITRLPNGTHHAQLFNSVPSKTATHTAWLLREIVGDHHGAYTETWKPFELSPGAAPPVKEKYAQQALTPPRGLLSPTPESIAWGTPNTLDTVKSSSSATTGHSRSSQGKKKYRHAQPLNHGGMPASDYNHLTVEEILDGAIEPDEICGGILLHLAKFYTYAEITERLNATRNRLGKGPTGAHNTWKRVLSALKAYAKNDERQMALDRKALEDERARNIANRPADFINANGSGGSKKSQHRGTKPTRKAKKAKMVSDEWNDGIVFEEEVGELDDDEVAFATSGPTVALTRISRQRGNVNYALPSEHQSDDEDGDRDLNGDLEASPSKRMKNAKFQGPSRVQMQDDDSDVSEYEDEDVFMG